MHILAEHEGARRHARSISHPTTTNHCRTSINIDGSPRDSCPQTNTTITDYGFQNTKSFKMQFFLRDSRSKLAGISLLGHMTYYIYISPTGNYISQNKLRIFVELAL